MQQVRLIYWIVTIHGVICILAAWFPLYPPVFLVYWLFPGNIYIKLSIILLIGVGQLVYGGYKLIKNWKIQQ
jgi:hypothetical protein